MTEQNNFDVIIVGAGPAGAAAALYAKKNDLKVLLLDKATFPRDKICGDALSGKAVTILKELDLIDDVRGLPGAPISRIVFGSPNGSTLNIDLANSKLNQIPEGFVIRRQVFDQFMFERAQVAATKCIQGFTVSDLLFEDGFVKGVKGAVGQGGAEVVYRAPIVMGADGYRSIVSRKVGFYRHDKKHVLVALRQYYTNVADLTDQIELHFINEVNPGYFWVFPVDGETANIGIGMQQHAQKRENIDLKHALKSAIHSPRFKNRFANATPLENPVGWMLPVGSKHYPSVGNGFMLLGDAAGLIDPFTGEGIGNALYSAKFAVSAAVNALAKNDFSKQSLSLYDKNLWAKVGTELRNSSQLQKLARSPRMLNWMIAKADRNRDLSDLIAGMIANEIPRQKLANPLFYLKILFN